MLWLAYFFLNFYIEESEMTKRTMIKVAMPLLQGSLVKQIVLAMILGIACAYALPNLAQDCAFLGSLFISALKAVAPLLVFVLVMSAIANHDVGERAHIKPVLILYGLSTFGSALIALIACTVYPTEITLVMNTASVSAPGGVGEVLKNLLFSIFDNPVNALLKGNYIGLLAWATGLGLALRHASEASRQFMSDLSTGVEYVVKLVIRLAPLGVFGLVAQTVATTGMEAFEGYFQVLAVLVGCMVAVALIWNPMLVWLFTRRNPYPLTWATLRESGVMAFFTRSSAANIPVNMGMCRRLNLDESTYSITIPLGATINMAGAAITITVLTLAAVNSLNIEVSFLTALVLSVVAAVCACGASGVPGGSLMLIPLACGLFGIDANTAMEVVAVGFIIGVIQDSAETALNSSSDVLFTAAVCMRAERKAAQEGRNHIEG